jgi:uncharacterized protein YkwD
MEAPPEAPPPPRRLLTASWQRRLTASLVAITGAGLLLLASAFVVNASLDQGEAASQAERALPPASFGEQTFVASSLDVGSALAAIDPDRLFGALAGLSAALKPTPTPTAEPTATPRPAAVEQPFVPQAPAPSQPAAPPAAPADPPAASCPTASMGGFGLDLFNAINGERTSRGMPALAAHGCVVFVAQLRSNDMAANSYFSHTSPDGSTAFSLMDANGVPYGWAGENLARNNYPDNETVAVAIRDLMASQGHRDNILNPNFTHLGVAAVNDGTGMWYFTMVFIGPP